MNPVRSESSALAKVQPRSSKPSLTRSESGKPSGCRGAMRPTREESSSSAGPTDRVASDIFILSRPTSIILRKASFSIRRGPAERALMFRPTPIRSSSRPALFERAEHQSLLPIFRSESATAIILTHTSSARFSPTSARRVGSGMSMRRSGRSSSTRRATSRRSWGRTGVGSRPTSSSTRAGLGPRSSKEL